MFILCPDCHNHYDDTSHEENCGGPGGSPHQLFNTSAITDHVINTQAARGQAAKRKATK